MRISLLTQVVPNPPDAGPKIKTHYVLRTLAEEHDIDLFTFVRSDAEADMAHELSSWCRSVTTVPLRRQRIREPYYAARGWSTLTPFLVARDARQSFMHAVERHMASGQTDVVHADQLTMAQYLTPAARSDVRQVFDAHNAVWDLVRDAVPRQPTPIHRAGAMVEWRLLKRFEGRAARTSDLTLCVSEHDRVALEVAAASPIPSAIIPIGVEVRDRHIIPVAPGARRLLSVATMHYPPNAEAVRWFVQDIWPLIREQHAELDVDIVGARPPADIVSFGSHDSHIHVHGYVDQLESYYKQAAVFVVPLKSGSGVRVKILEAMARGIPVVSTTIGASGLGFVDGTHLMLADTPRDFASAIIRLVEHPQLRTNLAQAARQRVLELYDWRVCCRPLLDAYRTLAGGSKL